MKHGNFGILIFRLPIHCIRDFPKGSVPIFYFAGAGASFYFYNTQAEVDVFSEVIKEIQKFFAA